MEEERLSHNEQIDEQQKTDLKRFRAPILIGLLLFAFNLGYTIYLNYADATTDLLQEQIKINSELLRELQETKEVLFRIEENGRRVEAVDSLSF